MSEKTNMKDVLDAITGVKAAVDESIANHRTDVDERIEQMSKRNAEIAEQLEALKGDKDAFEKKLKEVSKDATLKSNKGVSLPGVEDTKEKFSFHKAFTAITHNNWKYAGFEKEVFEQTEKARAMGTTPATAGGYIVPIEIASEMIELLRPESVLNKLGATVLQDLDSIIQLPKQNGGSTAYWITENVDEITESELTFGQLTMRPRALACLSTFSKSLMKLTERTNKSIEDLVRRDFALALALEVDRAGLLGSGVAGEPIGIANTLDISTHSLGDNGGMWDFEAAKEMEGKLEDENALRGKLGYAMNAKVKRKLQKQRIAQYSGDTGGEYTMLPMSNKKLAEALDYQFETTTQIPTNLTKGSGENLSYVFFANWMEFLLGFWGGMALDASIHAGDSFKNNQVQIRAVMEVDTAVRHPESFCLVSDASTT